jgi:LPPG:FO 2-phospho-L-lactate transferase
VKVVVLAGGVGGSKLAHGLARIVPPEDLAIVVNVADDVEVHGLRVSPDLDTVMYTLAGLADPDTGWGVAGDTWEAAAMLERYGAPTWFRLGDRDLATNLRRTDLLGQGASLTEVTDSLARALGVGPRLLPATDSDVRTQLRTDDGWLEFQDYFVRRGHRDRVQEIRYAGVDDAGPTAEVLAAVAGADVIALAPSNPFLSVGPMLAMDRLRGALLEAPGVTAAVSPIVGGAAIRGPADDLFRSLGGEASASGVARHYQESVPGLLDGLLIDSVDAEQAGAIEALGVTPRVAQTVMRTEADRAALAGELLEFAATIRPARG